MSSHQPPYRPEHDAASDPLLGGATRPALPRQPVLERAMATPITGPDAPTLLTPHTPTHRQPGRASLPPPELPPAASSAKRGISRRVMLAGAGAVGFGALGAGLGLLLSSHGSQPSPSGPVNLTSPEAGQVAHLLRRAGFGPAPWDIADYLRSGVPGALDRLLGYQDIKDDLDARLDALQLDFSQSESLIRWFMLRAIYSKRPLEEKMTLFWHGVLTSSLTKIGGKQGYPLLLQQDKLLRAQALGRFDDLVRAITVDPAMLWWLDGRLSTGRSPNENYARELMELFTMGLGDASGKPTYTQDDVHQGSLALAGWTVRRASLQSVLVPARQYTGPVTFLGQTGRLGVDDVVRLVCAHPATGRHLAWRMWSFFVFENPSDADLQPLVDAYYKSDHSIAAMVRAMLTSPAFPGEKAYRARVKSPIEFVAGTVRGLGVVYDGKGIAQVMRGLGQVPFAPPNVSGWDGDKVSGAWVSTQTWMVRCNFVNALLAAVAGGNGNPARSPLQALLTSQRLTSAAQVADYFITALLDNSLADDRRTVLREAISAKASGPGLTLAGGASVPAAALRNMLYLLMTMPEYQMS